MDAIRQDIEKLITLPQNYQLVEVLEGKRNHQKIAVYRYQAEGKFHENGWRITALYHQDHLLSLKDYHSLHAGPLLPDMAAIQRAEAIWKIFDPDYAKGLNFLRVEHQTREVKDDQGNYRDFPVQWLKFAHHNGSYNWVTLGGNGEIVEIEVDSRWDYLRGRRKTEMWDNDDWVLAHEGKGPQLASPNALA